MTSWPKVRVSLLPLLLLFSLSAWGVPSYSRQTGFPCSTCHTTPPELTAFGRQFKLNGYTLANMRQIKAPQKGSKAGLDLNSSLPLSVMFQISDSLTQKALPGTQNGNVEFPQQMSLFLASAFSSHSGGFMQVTYSGPDDHLSMDNTDLRFADHTKLDGKTLVYGVDFNNNPTVEDLWNSTPAWGFPWISSDSAPGPIADVLIDGGLAQDVAGVGVYGMYDNHLYLDVTAYRSMHLGGAEPPDGSGFGINIDGAAPYARLAWQQQFGAHTLLEVGGYGMYVTSFPNAIAGPRDTYRDFAADFTLDQQLGPDQLSVYGTAIHERSDLDASLLADAVGLARHTLNSERLNATYHFGSRYALTAGVFGISGSSDATLYAPGAIFGSADGSPQTNGYILQAAYWPWQNINFTLQYTGYWKFNGGTTNYDGFGRNAGDNDTVYVAGWFLF